MSKVALSGLALGAAMAVGTAQAEPLTLSAEQMEQVKALRAQGEEQHKAGQHAESVESLQEAKKVLGIE